MNEKSQGMVLEQFNHPLQLRAIEIPPLQSGQILARITAAGICGSDVHMWTGKDPRTPLPMILGHEGVGEVVRIGGRRYTVDGTDLKEGQAILWNRGVVCGTCYWCRRAGQPELCPNRWVYGIHRSCEVSPYLNGCYSEYVILDAKTDVFLPEDPDVDPAVLVPASCSGATVAHAFDLCPPDKGDIVLVQGPGPLGIFAVAFAKEFGASEIAVIGGTPERLEICRSFGATTILNRNELSTEERRQAVMALTDGRGVDLAIEAVGQPEVFREGIDLVRRGGAYISVGVGAPAGTIELDLYQDIELKNLRLQGVWVSHSKHTRMAMDLILKHGNLFQRMIAHRLDLKDATGALEIVRARKSIKAVLIP